MSVHGTASLVWTGADGTELVANVYVIGADERADVREKPKAVHEIEANLVAYALGSPRWPICYVDASTGELIEHFGSSDPLGAEADLDTYMGGTDGRLQ
jgi:hypothetical protein